MKQLFTVLFLVFSFAAFGQNQFQFQQQNDIKLVIGTDTLRQPWVGGLNSPVFSTIKLNNDATEDLYVFDRQTRKSYTFLADNASGTWQWKYAPEYEVLFPEELDWWVLLRDFDGDGKKDIFTGNAAGTWMYKNQTPANGLLSFAAPRNLKFDIFPNMPLGAYALPAITDIDGDGDLDMLVFDDFTATTIDYYKNRSVELNYGLDSLKFTRETRRWGRMNRCGTGCNLFMFGTNTCRSSAAMHGGGATILALDLDGDNDRDILVGADNCPDLVRLTNSGTTTLADMTSAGLSTTYPIGTTPASIVNFPAAYYEDVNFDGKKDLLVAPFLADNLDKANFTNSAWLYQNNAASATAAPVFAFNKNNFLQDKMFDVGLEALPVLADIDADGDLDMLVSNFADYRAGTTMYRSSVSLYTNVGTASKPVFKLMNTDYLQFNQADYKGINLQFADMNGDGALDLIVKYQHSSGAAGYIDYIPNMALPNQPFNLSRANQVQLGVTINPSDSPFFYDMDGDGDLDMLLGTDSQNGTNQNSGAIHYIRRVGVNPAAFASWQMFTDNFGKIPRIQGRMGLRPVIADLNRDLQPDLITTDDSGVIQIYPDALLNLSGTFVGQNIIQTNSLLGITGPTALGMNLHLASADLDNDQKPDFVIGTNGGGLVYLKNTGQLLGVNKALETLKLSVYPNPANEILNVISPEKINVSVYDMAGKLLQESQNGFQKAHYIETKDLKPGVYFLKIATSDFRSAGRSFIVQH